MGEIMKKLWIFIVCFLGSCVSVQEDEALKSEKGIIVTYINSGELSVALRRLRLSLDKYPNDSELNNLMGLVQLSLKNYKSSLDYFQRSYQIEPKPLVELNISSAMIETGDHKGARTILARLIKTPKDKGYQYKERLYHNLAFSYQKTKNYTTAIRLYKKALEENPTYHMSWQNMGQCYEFLKNTKLALDSYQKAKLNCFGCYEPITLLVDFHLNNNNTQAAVKELQDYLGVSSADARSINLAKQRLATLTSNIKQ